MTNPKQNDNTPQTYPCTDLGNMERFIDQHKDYLIDICRSYLASIHQNDLNFELVHKDEDIPFVKDHTSLKDSLLTISEKGLGITGVLDKNDTLVGIITDGDIRRGVEQNGNNIFDKTAKDFMSADPKVISSDTLAITALELMEKYNITSLFVYSSENLKKPDGVIHIHDILKAGIK